MRGVDRARELRKRQTDAEARLWRYLRNRQIGVASSSGGSIRLDAYIVDFVCTESRLIVELDGGQHVDADDEYDKPRTQ